MKQLVNLFFAAIFVSSPFILLGCDDSVDGSVDGSIDGGQDVVQPGHSASLYNTTFPTLRANLNGSRSVVNAGLPREATSAQIGVDIFEMPFPNVLLTGDEDELFVLGGMFIILETFYGRIDGQPVGDNNVSPYFSKVTPSTGEQIVVLLDRGAGVPYFGGALVHANGFVYAVSQAHLYKIEPKSMEIVTSIDLPRPAFSTIYNRVLTSSTGELILKSISQGFVDLELLMVDPDTLEITLSQDCECASARLAVEVNDDGAEYLYHINSSEIFRYLIEPGSLALDNNWISAWDPYENGGMNGEPTSPVVVKGKAHFTTNTSPTASTEPMRVFWQDTSAQYTRDMPALAGPLHFNGDNDSPGNSFSGLGADDVTGILVGNDQGNGLLNAYLPQDDGEIDILWQKELRVSASASIVSDREMVYTTDYVDGRNHLVVLDLTSGEELLRVPTPATRATLSNIVHSTNNETYFASPESGMPTGFVARFYVRDSE